jgi:heterotetrameric sarcosine oxidase gamma subunit
LELWGETALVEQRLRLAPPPPCRASEAEGLRLLWWEPNTWLVRTDPAGAQAVMNRLIEAAGDDGAVTDLSGAFVRFRITGAAWRELLMIGGVFDAESPRFGPGAVAGTVIHHMPVRLDVISEGAVDVYTPPSYAADLEHHWRRSAAGVTG